MSFEEYGPSSSPTVQDYPSPTAQAGLEEEATPVVTDTPIPASSYPQPPMSSEPQGHVTPDMLMSPFQPMTVAQHTDQYAYMQHMQHQQQQYPQQQQHHQPPQQTPAYVNPQDFQPVPHQYQHAQHMAPYPYNGSPLETTTPGFAYQPQMPMDMPFMPSQVSHPYMGQQQGYAYTYGPPQSRGQSPASSVSSSAVSLVRSASTSSDLHQKARPKTKLQFKDKANIVRIHKKDSSLRQEDIAKMYG
jgi:hypothetical protein